MQLTIAKDTPALRKELTALVKAGKRIALVPTMGALHDGHLALVETARQHADAVVASIFVNPMQFGPNEDFAKYPRMLEADIQKLDKAGAAVAYTPSVEDMYPERFATHVSMGDMGKILCGVSRPNHFDGVATVVAKLLLRTLPHVAVFGEKDYQQLCIVQRLAFDLDIPVQIIGMPTVREKDGLAMSSRNAYLTKEERAVAPQLHQELIKTAARLAGNPAAISDALKDGIANLTSAGFKVDYLELRASGTLAALDVFQPPARLLVAAWLGKTRLIDNMALE